LTKAALFSILTSGFRLLTSDSCLSCVFAHGLFDCGGRDVKVGYGPDGAAVAQDERLRRLVADAGARLYVAREVAALLNDDYRDGRLDLLKRSTGSAFERSKRPSSADASETGLNLFCISLHPLRVKIFSGDSLEPILA
jgi:hypothetical protein